MGEPERFFFVHLQKTGGTALFQRLREAFDPAEVYPLPEDQGDVRAVIDVDHLRERFAAHRDDLRVVTGHFPLCAVDELGVPFTTFTVLRHPIERTLSMLRRRQVLEDRFHGLALDEIYEDAELRAIFRDHMVKMLSLTAEEMGPTPLTLPVELDEGRLERAKRNLGTVDVIGLQEHFEAFCTLLEQRLGRGLGAPRFANRTPHGPVPEGLRERIAADNRLDVELYAHAEELVAQRQTAGGAHVG
jgi:hypothetical protein